jgi:hypothetical protein
MEHECQLFGEECTVCCHCGKTLQEMARDGIEESLTQRLLSAGQLSKESNYANAHTNFNAISEHELIAELYHELDELRRVMIKFLSDHVCCECKGEYNNETQTVTHKYTCKRCMMLTGCFQRMMMEGL